jgi:hypothetical protein
MEPEQELKSITNTFFTSPPPEDMNTASLYAELNLANNNRPKMFNEHFKYIDYEDEKARYHSTIYNTPKDQYKNQNMHNKLMRADQNQSHSMKTFQPVRKLSQRVAKLPRSKMNIKDILNVPPISGKIKQNFDWEFLSRIADKIDGFNANKRLFKSQKKHAMKNHFNIGKDLRLPKDSQAKKNRKMLTSTTSIHTPQDAIPDEIKQKEQEIKERLKSPSGVNKALHVHTESTKNPNTEARSKSVRQILEKNPNVMDKKLKSLYGNLKKSNKTHSKTGSSDHNKLKGSKSKQNKLNALLIHAPKIKNDNLRNGDKCNIDFEASKLDKVSLA